MKTVEYKYEGETVLKAYIFRSKRGRHIHYEVEMDELRLESILNQMNLYDKVHLKSKNFGLSKAIEFKDIDPKIYVDDAEIVDYVVNKGIKTKTELRRKDSKLFELANERGLVEKLFAELKPTS